MDKDLDNVYKALREQNKALQRIVKTLERLEKWICNPPKAEFQNMAFKIPGDQEYNDTQ